MSTKNTTTGSNNTAFQFDPGAMASYQKNLQNFLPFAQSLYKNPFGNQMFQQEYAGGLDQASKVGARTKSNILSNANALGYSTNTGLMNNMLLQANRMTGNLQGQAFRGAVGNANQRAMTGLGISSAFQPLMTGSNSNFNQTQTQSGLGTWLPQLIGAVGGAAMNAFMPGAGSIMDMTGKQGKGTIGNMSAPSVFPGVNGVMGAVPGYSPTMPSAFNYGGYGH